MPLSIGEIVRFDWQIKYLHKRQDIEMNDMKCCYVRGKYQCARQVCYFLLRAGRVFVFIYWQATASWKCNENSIHNLGMHLISLGDKILLECIINMLNRRDILHKDITYNITTCFQILFKYFHTGKSGR